VLISRTVKELVSDSGFRFSDRGVHTLKGVSGKWRLYASSIHPGLSVATRKLFDSAMIRIF
jgi:hypothetical protein